MYTQSAHSINPLKLFLGAISEAITSNQTLSSGGNSSGGGNKSCLLSMNGPCILPTVIADGLYFCR